MRFPQPSSLGLCMPHSERVGVPSEGLQCFRINYWGCPAPGDRWDPCVKHPVHSGDRGREGENGDTLG